MASLRLTSGQYLRPSAYIGYVFQARPVGSSGMPRLPCYIGMGSRLAQTRDLPITRSSLKGQQLSFTTVAPHIAPLPYAAMTDKVVAGIYTQNGGVIMSPTNWTFRESVSGSGIFDQVEIALTAFDRNATYLINYQSTDRAVQDELLIPEIRQILYSGSAPGEVLYQENVDYRIITSLLGRSIQLDALNRALTNSDGLGKLPLAPTPIITGTGGVTFNPAGAYNYAYSLHYKLDCTVALPGAPGTRTATFELTVDHLCGGNRMVHPVPSHPSSLKTYTFTIIENPAIGFNDTNFVLDSGAGYSSLFTDGIHLDFTFGGVQYVVGDTFEWDAIGAQLIEIPSHFSNTNQYSTLTLLESGNVNGVDPDYSSGNLELHVDADFIGVYNRKYLLEVISATTPVFPLTRTATVVWTGWGETPVTTGTINIAEATPASLTRILLEEGVYLNLDFGARHLASDPTMELLSPNATTLASAITLATEIRTKQNSHDSNGGAVAHAPASGLHQISAAVPTTLATLVTFCQDASAKYIAHIDDATEHYVIDSINRLGSHTISDLVSCNAFLNDLKVIYNRHIRAVNYVQGDTYGITAKANMAWYTGKDDRVYTLTATTVTPGTSIDFQWRTDQWESGWGNVAATVANPYISLGDSVTLAVRNFDPAGLLVQYVAADEFTFSAINDNLIDWTLLRRSTESIPKTDIKFDRLGRVTLVPLSYYVILSTIPESILRIKDAVTGLPLSYTWVMNNDGTGTVYVNLGLTNPNTTIESTYEWRGTEPDPSQVYYMTANRLRSDDEYETAVKHLYRENMNSYLRPGETTNHIWIMGNIAFDTAFFGCFTVQVKSASGDDVYTDADYKRAVDATEKNKDITDICVLSRYQVLGYSKLSVERMSSPFQGKERLLWQGVPIGTPLGDAQTPNTLVYLAKTTLQFYGNSPGRGRVTLLANRWADRQVVFDDGTATVLRLDGSFIAGYTAALVAGFNSPIETILRKDCASFQAMDTWGEKEVVIIGDASILWLDDVGSSIFRYGESHTVDTGAADVNEISAMTQKDYVTRRIRSRIDQNLIGLVVPSPAAGVIQVQSFLTGELGNLVSEGLIAPYGSEATPPTIRNIDAGTDTFVIVDERDRRKYHIGYWFNIIYPIKWILGLYSVDSRWWDNRSLASPS